ncbi:MAG: MFS transporter [Fibrobacteria bacterium]|nr:MFS transporter [Fibrobacteria bacterium]
MEIKKSEQPRITDSSSDWNPGKSWPWLVCIFLMFATSLSYLDRNAFSIVAPVIQGEFGWDNETIGRALSAFFIAYGIMHLFVGLILDSTNIRFTYGLFVMFWSITQMCTGLVQGLMTLFLCRFMLGIFESAGHTGGMRIISRIVPERDRTLANSILISGGSFGALIAPPLMIYLNSTVGWRYGFMVLGGLGVVWSILWMMWFKAPEYILTGKKSGKVVLLEEDRWSYILKSPKFWGCIGGALLVIPIIHVTYSWVAIYFVQVWDMQLKIDLAGYLLVIALGFEVALYVSGVLVSYLSRRGMSPGLVKKYILIGSAIMMGSVAFITSSPTVIVAVVFLFCLNFGRAAFNPIFYSFIQSISQRRVGTMAGIMGAIGSFAGSALIYVIGIISKDAGFQVPFIMVGVIGVLGVIPLLFVNWDKKTERT